MKTNTNKDLIIQNIYSLIGTSKSNIQKITEDLINIIVVLIYTEKKVNIKNFGTFKIKSKNKRVGRNPKTREKYLIEPRNTIKFTAANKLKLKIYNN